MMDFNRFSVSDIQQFCISPKHFKLKKEKKLKATKAMKFGTAFHAKILEPETFKKTCKRESEIENVLRTVEDLKKYLLKLTFNEDQLKKLKKPELIELAKLERSEFHPFYLPHELENDFILLTDTDFVHLDEMEKSVFENEFYQINKDYGFKETKLTCEFQGITLVGVPDQVFKKNDTVFCIDYKTADSAHIRKFEQKVRNEKLFVQDYLYKQLIRENFEGVKDIRTFFFCVEKKPPYISQAFELNPMFEENCKFYIEQKIKELRYTIRSKDFFGYSKNMVEVVDVPSYVFENIFNIEGL